ncbi:MAG: NAD(P)H-hydrate epimerase, partial [Chloroflexota bacterium]
MKLATTAEMRALEQGAVALGLTLEQLMDRAGAAVAAAVQRLLVGRRGRALVLVGPGNNGGDGLVCAEQLRQAGWELALAAVAGPLRNAARFPILQRVQPGEVPRQPVDVVVDALLGTGASRPLEGPLAALLDDVRQRQPSTPVVAVDVPSGVNADSGAADPRTLAARLTVSLGLAKPGL